MDKGLLNEVLDLLLLDINWLLKFEHCQHSIISTITITITIAMPRSNSGTMATNGKNADMKSIEPLFEHKHRHYCYSAIV